MDSREVKKAWGNVGDELSSLGLKLKLHMQEESGEDGDSSEVTDALHKLAQAIDRAVDAAGNAVKDPAIRDDFKESGQLLVNALGTTFEQALDGVRSVMDKGSTSHDTATDDGPED